MAILVSEERIDEALALAYGLGAINEGRIRDGEAKDDDALADENGYILARIRDDLKRA